MATWTVEGTTGGDWTIESGGTGSALTTTSTVASAGTSLSSLDGVSLLDNANLSFGDETDFSFVYNSTTDRLEFNNVNGTTLAYLNTSGLFLDQVNLTELSSLPTPVEGSLVYHDNEYYLGFP